MNHDDWVIKTIFTRHPFYAVIATCFRLVRVHIP